MRAKRLAFSPPQIERLFRKVKSGCGQSRFSRRKEGRSDGDARKSTSCFYRPKTYGGADIIRLAGCQTLRRRIIRLKRRAANLFTEKQAFEAEAAYLLEGCADRARDTMFGVGPNEMTPGFKVGTRAYYLGITTIQFLGNRQSSA